MGCIPASGELNAALRPLFEKMEHVYVIQDDLVIAGESKEQHDQAMDKACQVIRESGMTLNPSKCLIAKEKIPWWGMTISEKGLSPDPQKIEGIKQMTPPTSKEEVTSFMCMIQSEGYGRDFIPHLAEKTRNIRKLLKKSIEFKWNPQCQQEFD